MPKTNDRAFGIAASSSIAEIRRALSSPSRTAALSENDLVTASEIAGSHGKWDLGVQVMKLLVEREPQNALWYHRLGHFLVQAGDLDGAAAQCLKAVEVAPAFQEAYDLLRA